MSDTAGGSPGLSRLAAVITKRMKEVSEYGLMDIESDLGTINMDGSLTTDMFPISIPRGDYYLGRLVSGMSVQADGSEHSHTVILPRVKAGDRVLVVWVKSEAIVVDVVKKS